MAKNAKPTQKGPKGPAVSPLTRDDLLTWHEVLHDIENVTPWQP